MMNLVTFSLDVQDKRSSLSLDVAHQVIVVVELKLGLEQNFNWNLRSGRNDTSNWVASERVSKVRTSLDTFFREVETEWNVFLVNEVDSLSVLTRKEERSELNLSSFKENIGLVDSSNYEEVLDDIL
jgi:hypothetical protein